MIILAASITKKPRRTEPTLDLYCSLASALSGKTNIKPIQTMIPIANTLAIICIRLIMRAVKVRKSEPDSVTA